MNIQVNNSQQVIEKNHMNTNCSYAQLSGFYFNKMGFQAATETKLNTEQFDPDKYIKAKETMSSLNNFVSYDAKSSAEKTNVKTQIKIQKPKQYKKESYGEMVQVSKQKCGKVIDNDDIINKPVVKKEKDISEILNNPSLITSEPKVKRAQPVKKQISKKPIKKAIKAIDLAMDPVNQTEPVITKQKVTSVLTNTPQMLTIKKTSAIKKYVPTDGNLYLNGWVKFRGQQIRPNNFGDDINFTFLQEITGYKHRLYNTYSPCSRNFTMIGSIFIDRYINKDTIVWGAGMLREKQLVNKPYSVCAVRGPLTRDVVLKSGIKCPEVYGDPALLIPYYYHPYVTKKYKIGIIPHHSNIDSKLINKFKDVAKVKIIDFTSYNDWKDIIKDICQCVFIVSESLHGLIISEAYHIPNIWISLSDIGQDMKYEDFFLSVGKTPYLAYKVTKDTKLQDLLDLKHKYDPTFTLDLKKLVNACPVQLKNINMANKIKPYKGKVMLCCIGKMENNYIREFVQYYQHLGFDNICLYDNNDVDGERFEDVIPEYIKNGFVILKDYRGKELAQIPAYTDCYNTYKNDYDWIAYFDIDEFLHIDGDMKIKEFLSKDCFNTRGVNAVRVCWKQFTDSDIIKTENNFSVKKYKDFLPITRSNTTQTKIILKTQLDNVEFSSPHGPLTDKNVICVNTAGELCSNSILITNKTWQNAQLNHYRFKTIEEFVLNKMVRLWPTKYKNGGRTGLNLDLFFMFNKKTKEKLDYANYLLDKYNISRNE